jgi:HK97 family phage major capsid protein
MNLAQMKERLAVVLAKLEELNAVENFNDEIVNEINDFSSEFEGLKSKIEAKEKMEVVLAASTIPARKVAPEAVTRAEVLPARTDKNGGFKSFGEFLGSVKNAANGKFDKRFDNTMFERNGEDGGFLIPEEMLGEVSKKLQADESLLSKTKQFQVAGNSLSIPTDETSPWSGGVSCLWASEGGQYTASKNKFGVASLKLHKLTALVTISDELLEDSTALESYIKTMAPEAIMHKVNSAILTGDGVGKPKGLLNAGFKIAAPKEGGQVAATIVARNVIKMYSSVIPSARAGAAWYINAGCEEQLRMMKDDLGNFIYLSPGSQMNQSPYGVLLGLPVIPLIGSMPALGDEGDIILANLGYYYTIVKAGGMKQAVSSHLYFDRDLQAYKFSLRLDGQCPFKTPVVTEFGNHSMSAIVTLADRH